MRILRSRSDQEVSSNGFALFMAGLIVAGFIGGAIRTALSSEQIQNRILTELQAALPALQVKMDSARVSLARGIWPGLSISIPHLHLVKPEACGEASGALELDNIDLPLDIFPLLRSRVHWDTVTVDRLTLSYSRTSCEEKTVIPELAPPKPLPLMAPPAVAPTLTESAERVREHIGHAFAVAEQLRDHIRGVRIHRAEITSSDDPKWKVTISDMDVQTRKTLRASASVHFEKYLPGGRIDHDAIFTAEAKPDQLKWDVRSPLKEGLITWTGQANHVSDRLEQNVTIRQVPLKDVLSEAQALAGHPNGGSPRFIWLSCDLTQTGPLSQFKALPMEISNCKIDGEGEQIRIVAGQQIWPWERTPLHQALQFEVNQLSLQTVLDLFAQEGLPAIIPKPGQWTGHIHFLNPKSWQMDGQLAGAEVVFSNQSIRGKQVLTKVNTKIEAEDGVIHLELSDIAVADGSSEGKVDLRYDPARKSGEWDIDFDSFALSPVIQSLMMGGSIAPVKLAGHGRLENGEVRDWKGQAHWKSSQGRGWQVGESQLDTGYQGGIFSLHAHIQDADLSPDFFLADFLKTVIGDRGPDMKAWKFHDGAVSVFVAKAGGVIKDAKFHMVGGRNFHFLGQWERGAELAGTLESVGDGASKKWKVRGWDGKLSAEPVASTSH